MLNLEPRTIYCRDNLDILQGINSDCIDLIYLDPPFNKQKVFAAPIGSSAEGAEFSDIFREEDIKAEWIKSIEFENVELHEYLRGVGGYGSKYNYCYLVYMAIRLIECHRILKRTGCVYLHCDPTMSHYIKLLLDCVFGERNFRNEIIWHYGAGLPSKKDFARKHDIIFRYSKTKDYVFNSSHASMRIPFNETATKMHFTNVDDAGRKYRKYASGKISYLDEGKVVTDVWTDIDGQKARSPISKEYIGYPTQKPRDLLERIIAASSNEGDVVLDPFCGCATTCIAAEKLGRVWIGIDVSHKTFELVNERLEREVPSAVMDIKPLFSTTPPKRTAEDIADSGGYVYVISNPAFSGRYKVGVAKDVDRRLNSYQTSDPDRAYKVEHKKWTSLYREIETDVHRSFTNQHEWVEADLSDIIKKIEGCRTMKKNDLDKSTVTEFEKAVTNVLLSSTTTELNTKMKWVKQG